MKKIISLIGFLALVFAIASVSSAVTIHELMSGWTSGPSDWCLEIAKKGEISCSTIDFKKIPSWYDKLNKPAWQPPAKVFGPVWSALYIMIAISGWLVWRRLATEKFFKKLTSLIMAPYWLQLLLNFLWSILFFGMHQPVLSLVDIALLLVVIGINIGTFCKVSKAAAYLLVPYFLWVAYAISLNAAIVALN